MPDKISIDWRSRRVAIETAWVGSADAAAPVMVFLHEGLGSVAQWKNFPDTLCRHLGMRGLLYSRPGYGASTPRAPDEHWGVDFMHQQALEVLPAVLAHYGIASPWLYGHSDGGSIALLFAAHFPQVPAGVVVAAPHILVEEISVTSIAAARDAYAHGWHAITRMLIRLFMVGAMPGSARPFAVGPSNPCSGTFSVRYWRYRAKRTNTEACSRCGAFARTPRRPRCSNLPPAVMRRISASPSKTLRQ